MKLVLFDIDGTLVDCGGQARLAFADALQHVMGTTGGLESYDFSGKLDGRIVTDLLLGMGLSREDVRQRLPVVQEAYLERLERSLDRARMQLLPGVGDLLDSLESRDDIALGLLTGNWERGGRIKIGRFDLNAPAASATTHGPQRPAPHRAERVRHPRPRIRRARHRDRGSPRLECESPQHPLLAIATSKTDPAVLAAEGEWLVDDLAGAAGHPAFGQWFFRLASPPAPLLWTDPFKAGRRPAGVEPDIGAPPSAFSLSENWRGFFVPLLNGLPCRAGALQPVILAPIALLRHHVRLL
jgi:phosphoglycolate phosphatase-like HAD superfamily hydrolase